MSKDAPERLLHVEVICTELPGIRFEDALSPEAPVKEPVHLAIQRNKEHLEAVPGNAKTARFLAEFRVEKMAGGKTNFLGPYAFGTPADRFLYLVWGVRQPDGSLASFRRLKLRLGHLRWATVERAVKAGRSIKVRLRVTDARGGPMCATPPADHVEWELQ